MEGDEELLLGLLGSDGDEEQEEEEKESLATGVIRTRCEVDDDGGGGPSPPRKRPRAEHDKGALSLSLSLHCLACVGPLRIPLESIRRCRTCASCLCPAADPRRADACSWKGCVCSFDAPSWGCDFPGRRGVRRQVCLLAAWFRGA